MCHDPDSLGAAIICYFLMTTGKRKQKEFSYGSALTLVKDRRNQTDISLKLTEVLQKKEISDKLKVAVTKRVSVKQKSEKKAIVTRQDQIEECL